MATVNLEEKEHFPVQLIYHGDGSVVGASATTSKVARVPRILSFSGLAGAAAVEVYAQVAASAVPVLLDTLDATSSEVLLTFDPRYNFVYCEVTNAGDEDIICYAQS